MLSTIFFLNLVVASFCLALFVWTMADTRGSKEQETYRLARAVATITAAFLLLNVVGMIYANC